VRQTCLVGALLSLCISFSGCSTPARAVASKDVANYQGPAFSNILVVAVAQDYDSRARFERTLASELAAHDVSAVAYYQAVGGNLPIDRDSVMKLVTAEGFDAVLITRVVNRDTITEDQAFAPEGETSIHGGSDIGLHRYNYEALNKPDTLNIKMSVVLSSEVFATENSQKVWAIESNIPAKDMVSELIDDAVRIIVRRLARDDLIG
jgi:hypothetical protein